MTSTIVETVTLPAEEYVGVPEVATPTSLFDPAYVAIATVAWTATHMVEVLGYPEEAEPASRALRDELEERVSTSVWRDDRQAYVETLEAAVLCARDVVNHDRAKLAKANLTALDAETLAAVRGSIGYLAPHFEIDVEFPALRRPVFRWH